MEVVVVVLVKVVDTVVGVLVVADKLGVAAVVIVRVVELLDVTVMVLVVVTVWFMQVILVVVFVVLVVDCKVSPTIDKMVLWPAPAPCTISVSPKR